MRIGTDAIPAVALDLSSGSGLDAVGEAVAGARVVLLGEGTHGDGATFAAKVALIQYLHQVGFTTLAWEAGLYDCWRMDRAFASGIAPMKALERGVHSAWLTEEVRPFAEYVAHSWQTDRPLRQVGFDTQFSSAESWQALPGDLRAWFADAGIDAAPEAFEMAGRLAAHSNPYLEQLSDDERVVARDHVVALLDAAGRVAPDGLVTRVLRNTLANEDIYTPLNAWMRDRRNEVGGEYADWAEESDPFFKHYFSVRDRAMADNLLTEVERNPDERFVCWLANGHAQRNVHLMADDPRFSDLATMGGVVCEALGKAAYVIVATSFDGDGDAGSRRRGSPMSPADSESLEAHLHRFAPALAFFDARQLPPESTWRRPRQWRAWGPEQHRVPLPELTDGVLYIDRQTPAHFV